MTSENPTGTKLDEIETDGFDEFACDKSDRAVQDLHYHHLSSKISMKKFHFGDINRYTLGATLLSCISSALLGYDIGVTSGALLFISEVFELDDFQKETYAGSLNLIALLGAFLSGRISDWIGRRKTLLVASILFLVGALTMAMATTFAVLMIGRMITGLGVGFGLTISPLYTAELSSPSHRGTLVSLSELFINIGILFGYVTSYSLEGLPLDVGWRVMLGLGGVPALVLGFSVLGLPESPRWLVMRGRLMEARTILAKLASDGEDIDARMDEIVEAAGLVFDLSEQNSETQTSGSGLKYEARILNLSRVGKGVWKEILWPSESLKQMLIVCIGINFFQQATGIDATVYYSPIVFKEAGIRSRKGLLAATVAVGITKTIFVAVATLLLDYFGRRPLLLTSTIGMTLSLLAQSVGFFILQSRSQLPNPQQDILPDAGGSAIFLSVIATCCFVIFFGLGMGPVCWVLSSEIFPNRVRAQAFALGTAVNRLTSGVVSMTYLSMTNAITPAGSFLFFGIIGVMSVLFFYYYVPETKGKSLEEIEKLFSLMKTKGHSSEIELKEGGDVGKEAREMDENGVNVYCSESFEESDSSHLHKKHLLEKMRMSVGRGDDLESWN